MSKVSIGRWKCEALNRGFAYPQPSYSIAIRSGFDP